MEFLVRRPLLSGIAAAILTSSCAGGVSQPPVTASNEAGHSASAVRSAPASPGVRHLIFVGTYDDNAVGHIDIFDGKTLQFVRETEAVRLPAALAVDRRGYLYESDSELNKIQIFAPPYERVSRALDDQGYAPNGLHVDASGNVWLANFCVLQRFNCDGPGDVVEYVRGTGKPVVLNGGPYSPVDVTTDAEGNVWADGLDASKNCIAGYWAKGSGTFVASGIDCNDSNPNGNVPGWVAFDSAGNLLLGYAPNNEGTVGVFPPGQNTPQRSITVYGDVIGFALDTYEKRIFVVDFNGFDIRIFDYAHGMLTKFLRGSNGQAYSVAVAPAPLP